MHYRKFSHIKTDTQIAISMVIEETTITILDKKKSIDMSHIWIGDSGASCHITHSLEGMYDIKNENLLLLLEMENQFMLRKLEMERCH